MLTSLYNILKYSILRSKFSTSRWGGSRYLPYAYTEKGVYMLMTVLRSELAVKQSKDFVRTFKKMKDYILGNQNLIGQCEVMQLSMQTTENTTEISRLRIDIGSVEKQMSDVIEQLGDVVTKSELAEMMNSFVNDEDNQNTMIGG
ncbi:MAG: ORF6N domain-containing protein [Lachnospiraceae bacterium]|nr:ORF6N domain-containing protein [Lachnospiraceae bacterium]